MNRRVGRPISGIEPKDQRMGFRVTQTTIRKFEECAKKTKRMKIDLFEEMVNALHEKVCK